jgi:hypothetical protein
MKGHFRRGWAGASLAALLLAWSPARADVIADWNAIAAGAVTASGRSDSYERARVMTEVSVAMFEAVGFNEGKRGSWLLVGSTAPLGASSEAAAAAAAHYVLSQLYPEQQVRFSVALVRSLEGIPDGVEKFVGQITGTEVGKSVHAVLSSGAATTPGAGLSR